MTNPVSPFRILVVCTGNVCRSPQAERLLAAEFARRGLADAVEVSSAGTAALVGEPMDAEAAAQTIGYGGNPSGHVARRLDAAMVEDADLVLTMELAHRAAAVRLVPRASRYAFTLPEFARLLADLRDSGQAEPGDASLAPASRLRSLVPEVAARRGLALPVEAESDEVPDPFGRPTEAHARTASQVMTAVTTAADALIDLGGLSASRAQ